MTRFDCAPPWLVRAAIVAAIAAVALWVHLYEFGDAAQYDAGLFLAIGKLLQRDLLLYRDLWDTKPPGIYLYQSAVFTLLPTEVWSLRLADYLLYVAGGVLFYRLCALEAGRELGVVASAVWLYWAHHPDFNMGGFYTEEYSAIAAVAAVAAAAHYWRAGRLRWVAASGVGAAAAVLFKHPGAACVVPAVVLISGRRASRALPLFGFAAVLPLLLVVAYFWRHHAVDALLDCQLFHLLAQHVVTEPGAAAAGARARQLAQQLATPLVAHPLYFIPAAIGVAVVVLRPNRLRIAALSWLAADIVLLALQRYYFEHYFIQLFPSLILLSAIGAAAVLQARASDRMAVRVARVALGACAIALAVPALANVVAQRHPLVAANWFVLVHDRTAWPRQPGSAFETVLGRYLREHTAPDDRVFIVESGSVVAAYWTADRLPASRYIFATQVEASVDRQREQLAELNRSRPAYVVVVDRPVPPYLSGWLEPNYHREAIQRLYDLRADLWVRNDHRPTTDEGR